MATIKVLPHEELCPEGMTFEATPGISLCQALLDQHIEIEHACAMSCACTTCHVIIREGFDDTNEPTDIEEDLLDMAWGLEAESRLSCQVQLRDDLDLIVEIPKYTINHAKEDH
ncbi:MAG: ISC system 2Fe-2S type ferredoxin [Lautropia sp.]|nr:ISC system 2Fe-2S type ferredoxin [Lautropia sp.]